MDVGWSPRSGDVDSSRLAMFESVLLVADVVAIGTCASSGNGNESEETKVSVLLLAIIDGDVAIVSTSCQIVRRVGVSCNSGIQVVNIWIFS
jgi:hypothetical protein